MTTADLETQENQQISARVLLAMAGGVSKEIASFSSWMIAGAGAIFALAISNYDNAKHLIDVNEIGQIVRIFLYAAALNMIQRWLGARVIAVAAVVEMMTKMPALTPPQLSALNRILLRSTYRPMRWLLAKNLARVEAGDLLGTPVLCAGFAQLQSHLLITQMGLLLYAGFLLLPG